MLNRELRHGRVLKQSKGLEPDDPGQVYVPPHVAHLNKFADRAVWSADERLLVSVTFSENQSLPTPFPIICARVPSTLLGLLGP
jgi:hypothetical protein